MGGILFHPPVTPLLQALGAHGAGLGVVAEEGGLRGFWAVTVRADWRIIRRFEGANAVDVDLIDYH